MIGAEAHPVFTQGGARGLVEALHVLRHLLALEHAEPFGQLERDAARHAGDVLGGGELEQGAQELLDMRLEPEVEPRLHGVARGAGELLIRNDPHARLEHLLGRHDLAHRLALPADHSVGRQHELVVGRLPEPARARVDLDRQHLLGGAGQRLGVSAG